MPKSTEQPNATIARAALIREHAAGVPLSLGQIAEEIAEYKAIQAQARELEVRMKALREEIRRGMVAAGLDLLQCSAGKVIVRRPWTYVTYHTEALDALRDSDPALADVLSPLRLETPRPALVTIL